MSSFANHGEDGDSRGEEENAPGSQANWIPPLQRPIEEAQYYNAVPGDRLQLTTRK